MYLGFCIPKDPAILKILTVTSIHYSRGKKIRR